MSYGLSCYNSSGSTILSITGRYPRLLYMADITDDGSVTLPALEGKLSAQWIQLDNSYNLSYGSVSVTRSGTTISWETPTDTDSGKLYIFIYT